MSIVHFPRIYFGGEISWDPGLGNNFDVYDPVNVNLNVPAGTTLAELKTALPITLTTQEGGRSWNHFGTHRVAFENVRVTGVSLQHGQIDTSDPLVNRSLSLDGKLVDLNPAIDHGTQVYFDKIQLGNIAGGLVLNRRKRMFMRYLNFFRNAQLTGAAAAGAVWEVCFPKPIEVQNPTTSSTLNAIQEVLSLDGIQGLAMRFHTYRTEYFQNGIKNSIPQQPRSTDDLAELYANGANFSNPAYSRVVGVIMPWTVNETEGHPGGRLLRATAGGSSPTDRLGLTFVEVDRANRRITVDFGQTIPEANAGLDKEDFGNISVGVQHNGQETIVTTIAPRQYDKMAYERSAGLVDIDGTGLAATIWDAIDEGTLWLKPATQAKSSESDFVVAVEDRDIYLDEGDGFPLSLAVTHRGRIAVNTSVQVAEYDGSGALIGVAATLPVDANGRAEFEINAESPGFRTFIFKAFSTGQIAPAPDPSFSFESRMTAFHANVRTLPFDNQLAADTPDNRLTWNWIYENVLAVYDVLNPVMSRSVRPAINRPLDDRNVMQLYAAKIKEVTEKSLFGSKNYMPVTRELSNGKRQLLHRWCDLVLSGNAPPNPVPKRTLQFSSRDRRVETPDNSQ